MALTWTAKAPGDVYRYTWTPALADGDTLASYTVTESGAVIDAQQQDGDSVILFVSGGTAGTTASFAFTGHTTDGETLTETVYLPIIASTAATDTVHDVCSFALRKVFGLGEEPNADALEDAIERLGDMLAMWRGMGADVGAPAPLVASTVLKCRPEFVAAIKNNLILVLADIYGAEIGPMVAQNARTGLQRVKAANLPVDREGGEFF